MNQIFSISIPTLEIGIQVHYYSVLKKFKYRFKLAYSYGTFMNPFLNFEIGWDHSMGGTYIGVTYKIYIKCRFHFWVS